MISSRSRAFLLLPVIGCALAVGTGRGNAGEKPHKYKVEGLVGKPAPPSR